MPRVNPVGLVEYPDSYRSRPRRLPLRTRLAALFVLACFAGVGTAATVASLGRYCLTSHASAAAPLGHR